MKLWKCVNMGKVRIIDDRDAYDRSRITGERLSGRNTEFNDDFFKTPERSIESEKFYEKDSNDYILLPRKTDIKNDSRFLEKYRKLKYYRSQIQHDMPATAFRGSLDTFLKLYELLWILDDMGTDKVIVRIKRKERKVKKKAARSNKTPTFFISSMFLVGCWKYLMSYGMNESLCYITGMIDKETNKRIPIKMLNTKMRQQSPIGVTSDLYSTHNTMETLDRYHHPLMCLFHKHPGSSIPWPSSIDVATHRDYEEVYDMIGGIFVKSGYITFFSVNRKFNIEIFGKGVETIDRKRHVYKVSTKN